MADKHFLVHGAQCKCEFGAAPDKLSVLSQQKDYINDGDGAEKLIASTKDIGPTFEKNTFGSCTLTHSSCAASVKEWLQPYPNVTLSNGGKILTEDSLAICPVSGCPSISVIKQQHGQKAKVTEAHFNQVQPETLTMLNPLAPPSKKKAKDPPKIKSIKVTAADRGITLHSKKNTEASIATLQAGIDESLQFEVEEFLNASKCDKNKTGWKVIHAHSFDGEAESFGETGPSFKVNFDALGSFRIIAYGSPEGDTEQIHRCIDVEVVKNSVTEISIKDAPAHARIKKAKNGAETIYVRKGLPVTFSAKYMFTPVKDEDRKNISMQVTDLAGNILQSSDSDTITYIPPNSAAVYIVKLKKQVTAPDEHAAELSKTFHTEANGVLEVVCVTQQHLVRPGTPLSFEVKRLTYSTLADSAPFEQEAIQWKLNGRLQPVKGPHLTLSGAELIAPGKYIIDAFVPDEQAGLSKNDWQFEVRKNRVINLEGPTEWIAGKKYDITAQTEQTYDAKLDGRIQWTPSDIDTTPQKCEGVYANTAGNFVVTASLAGNTEPAVLKAKASYARITRWSFSYFNKDVQREGSIGLETNLHLIINGLTDETVKVNIWEHKVEHNWFSTSGAKMVNVKSFTKKLSNGELFEKIQTSDDLWKKLQYDDGLCQIFFTLEKSGDLEHVQFEQDKVKAFAGGSALYGQIFPATNNKDIGVYLKMISGIRVLDACFVNSDYKKLYKVIKYGDTAYGLVKLRGIMPGAKVKVGLIENLVNDSNHKTDPVANNAGEIAVLNDGTLKIEFKTSKGALGEHNKYVKNLAPGTPRTFYMALYHGDSKLLFPVDVGDNDITNEVANVFQIAKNVAHLVSPGSEDKQAMAITAAYVKRNYFLQLKVADTDTQNTLLSSIAPVVLGEKLDGGTVAPGNCVCKEYDLIWGSKFKCAERKKIVEMCSRLWPQKDKIIMANYLMACMAVETDETFSPSKGYSSGGATGLVQWTGDAIDGMNKNNKYNKGSLLTKSRLAHMTVLEQLDYVELYFKMWIDRGKIISDALDMYMCIWCPKAVGRDDSFVCYDENNSSKNYNNNSSIDGEYYIEKYTNKKGKTIFNTIGKGEKDGQITKGELKPRIKVKQIAGQAYKSKYEECASSLSNISFTKDVITYYTFYNGKIEKHIPKVIKSGYEGKYKYVYCDQNNGQHEICIADWHETIKKMTGQRHSTKPVHSKIISDSIVSEGQTSRRVIYENGDVAEYGVNKGKYFWNLYACVAGNPKIEVIKMPNSLDYSKSGILIKYSFSDTQRRYTCPGALAGFIGALAECGYSDISTTGSCFKEGTCFPSVAHVNGKSIDTKYINKERESKFIEAMKKFKFSTEITGTDGSHTYKGTIHKSDHNDHLHSGFDESQVIIIKE
ncbi:DUF4280 domain-containing protein [Chitinophagaceae bacterium MMS25-I14]